MKRRQFISSVGISIGAGLLYSPYKLLPKETISSEINYPDEMQVIVIGHDNCEKSATK